VGAAQTAATGLVLDAQFGYIVTTTAAVAGAAGLQVQPAQLVEQPARLLGTDPQTGVSVLAINAAGLQAASVGDSDRVVPGQTLFALVGTHGGPAVVHALLVNAVHRTLLVAWPGTGGGVQLEDVMLLDLGGGSPSALEGAPLVDGSGQVVALATNVPLGGVQSLVGLASDAWLPAADQLAQSGAVTRPWLGISYTPWDLAAAQGTYLAAGVLVTAVTPGSPADLGGIRAGDVVSKLDDQELDQTHPLSRLLLGDRANQRVTLTVIRAGQQLLVPLTLGSGG
jgi:serine protease Do